jgi:hypothetical protein
MVEISLLLALEKTLKNSASETVPPGEAAFPGEGWSVG